MPRKLIRLRIHLVEAIRVALAVAMWCAGSIAQMDWLRVIETAMKIKKKTLMILLIVAGVAAFAWWLSRELKIDGCLDAGGRWNYKLAVCEKS